MVTIRCCVENIAFGTNEQGAYVTSVGLEALLVKGTFLHDFFPGSYYDVTGKFVRKGIKKELTLVDYTLSYPTDEMEISRILSNLCSDMKLCELLKSLGSDILFQIESDPQLVISKIGENKEYRNNIQNIHERFASKRVKEPHVRYLKRFNLKTADIFKLVRATPHKQ